MSVRIPLGPLDAEGIRADRPPSQVKWTEITNMVIHEGRFISRPGFEIYSRGGPNMVPSVQPAPIVALTEIFNPGSSATGRESYTGGTDLLVPTSDNDLVGTGWTGAFGDIDEGTPDGVATMKCATLGDSTRLGFGNPSVTYAVIQGLVFHVRARINDGGAWAKVNFYLRISSTNYLIHSQVVTTQDSAEADDWDDFYFTLSRNLATSKPLVQADVDALELVMELDSSESFIWENKNPTGNGTHQEWKDVQDAGTAIFSDVSADWRVLMSENSTLPTEQWMKSDGNGTRQSFTFASLDNTYASILYVEFGGFFRKPGGYTGESTMQISFYTATAVENSMGNVSSLSGQTGRIMKQSAAVSPDGGAAWTQAEIEGGEFGMEMVEGAQLATGAVSLTVFGTVTGNVEVQIDVVNVQVVGVTSSNPGSGGITDKTRLFSSNLWHNRLDGDKPSPTITDVTNSVPLNTTGPGWPVNHTTLYGQAFMVNGIDPTVFYPNGSNVFAELATNNSDGSTALTGRTVTAFGNRLFYGWVKDNTTVTPERISYSKWQDGSTHNDRSAGDFDLLDTPGGVVAMVPLDEQVMAVIKERGAYVIKRTGNDIFPFIRDVINFQVSCIGSLTAKAVQFAEGTAILFLGSTPTHGINVYMFDGKSVQPIGNEIARKLRDDMNHGTALLTAHAQVDPQTNTYWLFVPEGVDSWCQVAWVMNLQTRQWTRAEFPWDVYSSGTFHFPNKTFANGSSSEMIGGQPRMVIGSGGQYLPLTSTVELGYDEMVRPSEDISITSESLFDPAEKGIRYRAFTSKMTTGDLIKPGDMESVTYRIGMLFKAIDPVNRVLIDASIDGGKNYGTQNEYWFGPDDLDDVRAPVGGTYFVEWDLEPTHAAQVRYRLQFTPEVVSFDGTNNMQDPPTLAQRIEIHDMWITIESGADSE